MLHAIETHALCKDFGKFHAIDNATIDAVKKNAKQRPFKFLDVFYSTLNYEKTRAKEPVKAFLKVKKIWLRT